MSNPGEILMCDAKPFAIEGVRAVLSRSDDLRFAGSVSSLEAAFEFVRGLSPAVVLIDELMGIAAISEWLRRVADSGYETAAVIWGSRMSKSEAVRVLQAGARGVLRSTSEPQTLLMCLRAVLVGRTWLEDGIFREETVYPSSHLTRREEQVAELVRQGLRNRDIAYTLGIQIGTVKVHVKHILGKAGVKRRCSLVGNGSVRRPAQTQSSGL
jgi:two-component system nitrate/nitrite response regulator NarL